MKKNYEKSISSLIQGKYDSFTATEKEIADFFIHNTEKIDFSASEIASRLYVSKASLSRFAQKCGYKGYREFVYQYEQSYSRNKLIETGSSRAVLGVYQDFLDSFYNLVNEAQIDRIVKYINNAERLYVFGKGSSGLAASEMEVRFMRVGVNIDSIEDSDRMRMQTVFLNNRNLVFGISISGTTADVLYGLKEAHLRGAKTVLMTTKNDDSFNDYCDEVLLLPKIGNLDWGNMISPQYPILIMIDMLYFGYVKKDEISKANLHNETIWSLDKRKRRD